MTLVFSSPLCFINARYHSNRYEFAFKISNLFVSLKSASSFKPCNAFLLNPEVKGSYVALHVAYKKYELNDQTMILNNYCCSSCFWCNHICLFQARYKMKNCAAALTVTKLAHNYHKIDWNYHMILFLWP